MRLNRHSIWHEKQNKPTLVVQDLAPYVDEDYCYYVLLRRGVFKWLAVRRHLIKLKDKWKIDVCALLSEAKKQTKGSNEYWYNRGKREMLEQCRADVRKLCHSDRWTAPDFDGPAWAWLKKYEQDIANGVQ